MAIGAAVLIVCIGYFMSGIGGGSGGGGGGGGNYPTPKKPVVVVAVRP